MQMSFQKMDMKFCVGNDIKRDNWVKSMNTLSWNGSKKKLRNWRRNVLTNVSFPFLILSLHPWPFMMVLPIWTFDISSFMHFHFIVIMGLMFLHCNYLKLNKTLQFYELSRNVSLLEIKSLMFAYVRFENLNLRILQEK